MKKRAIKYNYDKICLFLFSILLAYWIFYERDLEPFHNLISSLGYFGTFASGALYTYGFTSPPATALLLLLAEQQNPILAALLGGLGSLFSDIFIFKTIKYSFKEEIKLFAKERKKSLKFIPNYLLTILGALIIASPLPDELGISLFAFNKKISTKNLLLMSYSLNTIGIFIILLIGKSI